MSAGILLSSARIVPSRRESAAADDQWICCAVWLTKRPIVYAISSAIAVNATRNAIGAIRRGLMRLRRSLMTVSRVPSQ
jgi:hypothetical protein